MLRIFGSFLTTITILFIFSFTAFGLEEKIGQGVSIKGDLLEFLYVSNENVNIDFISKKKTKNKLENDKDAQVTLTFPGWGIEKLKINFWIDRKGNYFLDVSGETFELTEYEYEKQDRRQKISPIYICLEDNLIKIKSLHWEQGSSDEKFKIVKQCPQCPNVPYVSGVKIKYWDESRKHCETSNSKVTTLGKQKKIPSNIESNEPGIELGGGVSVNGNVLEFSYLIDQNRIGRDVNIDFTSCIHKIGGEVYGNRTIKDWPGPGGMINLKLPLQGQKTLTINLEVRPTVGDEKLFIIKVTINDRILILDNIIASTETDAFIDLKTEHTPIYICSYGEGITRLKWAPAEVLDYPMFIPPCHGDGTQPLNVNEDNFLIFRQYPCEDKHTCKVIFTTWGRIIERKVCNETY